MIRAWDDGIRLDKVRDGRIVPPCVVVHQPEVARVAVLAGVRVGRRARVVAIRGVSYLPPRIVAQLRNLRAGIACRDGGAAQLVCEQVVHRPVHAHRNAACADPISPILRMV